MNQLSKCVVSFFEQDNRIVMEVVCNILHVEGLPKFLWVEVVNTMVHVLYYP
jgi:hypothetical protein